MRLKSWGMLLAILGLTVWGAHSSFAAEDKASPHVQQLIDKHNLQVVDFSHVKGLLGNGTRSGAKATLIDARPPQKYEKGTIPTSINIPDTDIAAHIGQLEGLPKDREMIVFCGGWTCEKSPLVAGYLQDQGYTKVRLYQAGEPDWLAQKGYLEVGLAVVKAALEKDSALLMDARPRKLYLTETIPGALYMNDEELERLAGRFPRDRATGIITFCGGYQCSKSHLVADRLQAQGYTNVSVFAAGMPAWKKAGLPTTAAAALKSEVKEDKPRKEIVVDGVRLGADEGTVEGAWFKELLQTGKLPATVALIDVRPAADFASGHLPGAVNIEASTLSATELVGKLPKEKVVIFVCGTGARAMEAFLKLQKSGQDVSKILYFDANITCKGTAPCTIEVNEPLG